MGSIVEMLGRQLATDIVHEASDEILGRSSKKWAVVLVAALAGIAIAIFVMQRRHAQVSNELVAGADVETGSSQESRGEPCHSMTFARATIRN